MASPMRLAAPVTSATLAVSLAVAESESAGKLPFSFDEFRAGTPVILSN